MVPVEWVNALKCEHCEYQYYIAACFHGILFARKAGAVWTVAVQRSDNRQLLHLAQKSTHIISRRLLVVKKKNAFLHIVHYLLTRR